MKSFYNNITLLHECNSDAETVKNCTGTEVIYTGGYIKAKYDTVNNVWFENATPQEFIEQNIKYIKDKYEMHRKNGWNAYQDFRAKIIIDISTGLITEQQAFLIEHDLKIAYDRIAQNGDWKTAYYELSQVTASYSFIQPYLDLALSYISNYIQENYDS